MSLSIKNQTRRQLPRISFENISEKVLGKKYELSLVFIGKDTSRRLNRIYRGKDHPTNVLSFSLNKDSGEIFIDLARTQKDCKKFEKNFKEFLTYLFIHGLLHLKGMDHGDTMEKAETRLLNVAANSNWY